MREKAEKGMKKAPSGRCFLRDISSMVYGLLFSEEVTNVLRNGAIVECCNINDSKEFLVSIIIGDIMNNGAIFFLKIDVVKRNTTRRVKDSVYLSFKNHVFLKINTGVNRFRNLIEVTLEFRRVLNSFRIREEFQVMRRDELEAIIGSLEEKTMAFMLRGMGKKSLGMKLQMLNILVKIFGKNIKFCVGGGNHIHNSLICS